MAPVGRHGLRAAPLLFVASPLVYLAALGALGAGPDVAVGLLAMGLLILVGSSAGAWAHIIIMSRVKRSRAAESGPRAACRIARADPTKPGSRSTTSSSTLLVA